MTPHERLDALQSQLTSQIDEAADIAMYHITRQAQSARRSLGQRFRWLI